MRTPFYGVLLIAGAMVGATVAKAEAPGTMHHAA